MTNTSQFQVLMFRPLYWFGLAGDAGLQPTLSTGDLPAYSNQNRTVSLTTKGWKFADGQTVNGRSVLFFLNMYKAEPSEFCTYTKGSGYPRRDQERNGVRQYGDHRPDGVGQSSVVHRQ